MLQILRSTLVALLLTGTLAQAVLPPPPTLKSAFAKHFLIGAALNQAQFSGKDPRGASIVIAQFNTISPENILKWESVHPELNRYDWEGPDQYVAFGVKNKMFIIGHTLVWHNQTPKWVFEDAKGAPLGREALLARLRDHIHAVVGRYKGKINGWDVVNEALNEDGTMRETQWLKIIGEDYLAQAFQFAHEADPKAELYYNDYSLENEAKRNGAIALIKRLQAKKVPIRAVGLQGHNKMAWPSVEQQDLTITEFAKLGIKVNITELDVDVLPPASDYRGADITVNYELQVKLNPYAQGLPDAMQRDLARRYAELFRVYVKHAAVIDRITFWCVTDGDSWLNDWPIRGRTSYPLLFDRLGQPKRAFTVVLSTATTKF
ncbi:MAG: endo-1,4-beta-xylanase [Pyrinomonadaceae bacterium]